MNATPDGITRLRDRIVKDLEAEVDVEASDEARSFTVWVTSPRFSSLTHLQRQDLLWAIVDETCDREESMLITLIMAFAPGEINEFVDSLGQKK
jgi:hypothetical protein